ncbi:hypothetical protein FRC12_024766 [Ceratobasidium sp. 428]|nr:hypothetical protein FRC12_024766 [Ceratobasidium sp. 428]
MDDDPNGPVESKRGRVDVLTPMPNAFPHQRRRLLCRRNRTSICSTSTRTVVIYQPRGPIPPSSCPLPSTRKLATSPSTPPPSRTPEHSATACCVGYA